MAFPEKQFTICLINTKIILNRAMKILLLNGSPRRGNTYTALKALKEGLTNIDASYISQIDTTSMAVAPCIACEFCKEHGRCAVNDDTNTVINEIAEADVIIFATPVYWWGISAQLKVIIDKFYSQEALLASLKKRIGVIVIGQLPQDNVQYKIIEEQFRCITDFLGWEMLFCNTYSAYKPDDISSDNDALNQLRGLWKMI